MGAKSVGLREMVMTMNRLASKVNRKMNKKTMESIFRKCGFCVNPKRMNSVTLLGGMRRSIQLRTTFQVSELSTMEERMIPINQKGILVSIL